ncbi:Glutathione S-transferase 1 [Phytophthora citrophthora]|uniref:Glutathione S-transferase 1 n=1 Tax=Phytophthora citrophthora TaxID=4793 RepID=A0AAD9H0A7_9STRA|nr:Glutathione S-transferase 1 [Phytophthora citrophthora]
MSTFPSLKLTYFDFAGRAESVRLALYVGGVPFEDNRLTREEFAALKSSLPLGQVPVLEVDGQVLTQTFAILRYAGRLGGLYPTNSFAALKVDEILHALCEMWEQMLPSFQETDEVKRKAMREELATVTIPHYASRIDARLEKMYQMPTFQSDTLFVHEIALYTSTKAFKDGMFDNIPATLLDGYKFHKVMFEKVTGNQKIKEWNSLPHGTPKLKLTYFPFAGRAEPIRLAFFIGGIDFEDERMSFEEYAKVKSNLPYSQLPVLEVDGEPVAQSLAILRYAGTLAGLYPTTDTLAAVHVDEIFNLIDEMFNNPEWRATIGERDPDKLQKIREGLSKGIIPKTLESLEKRVAAFEGKYATESKLNVADLAVYAVVQLMKAGPPATHVTMADIKKTVLITGSTRGIGLSLAEHYTSAGWNVIGTTRANSNTDKLNALSPLKTVVLDVSDESSVLKAAIELEGVVIDLLINNAGIGYPTTFTTVTKEQTMHQYEVNVTGPFLVTRAFLPNLQLAVKAHGSASVLQVSSVVGSITNNTEENEWMFRGQYGYTASKAALNMVTRSLAMDLREHKIPVVCMNPGLWTPR